MASATEDVVGDVLSAAEAEAEEEEPEKSIFVLAASCVSWLRTASTSSISLL